MLDELAVLEDLEERCPTQKLVMSAQMLPCPSEEETLIEGLKVIFLEPRPGQVQLDNGKFSDRDKVVFLLKADARDKTVLHASDRAYKQLPDGSLRRTIPKMTKAERKQNKKINHQG